MMYVICCNSCVLLLSLLVILGILSSVRHRQVARRIPGVVTLMVWPSGNNYGETLISLPDATYACSRQLTTQNQDFVRDCVYKPEGVAVHRCTVQRSERQPGFRLRTHTSSGTTTAHRATTMPKLPACVKLCVNSKCPQMSQASTNSPRQNTFG